MERESESERGDRWADGRLGRSVVRRHPPALATAAAALLQYDRANLRAKTVHQSCTTYWGRKKEHGNSNIYPAQGRNTTQACADPFSTRAKRLRGHTHREDRQQLPAGAGIVLVLVARDLFREEGQGPVQHDVVVVPQVVHLLESPVLERKLQNK